MPVSDETFRALGNECSAWIERATAAEAALAPLAAMLDPGAVLRQVPGDTNLVRVDVRTADIHLARNVLAAVKPRACRVCGCTDDDCSGCIERTGGPCHWVEADLCSACVGAAP